MLKYLNNCERIPNFSIIMERLSNRIYIPWLPPPTIIFLWLTNTLFVGIISAISRIESLAPPLLLLFRTNCTCKKMSKEVENQQGSKKRKVKPTAQKGFTSVDHMFSCLKIIHATWQYLRRLEGHVSWSKRGYFKPQNRRRRIIFWTAAPFSLHAVNQVDFSFSSSMQWTRIGCIPTDRQFLHRFGLHGVVWRNINAPVYVFKSPFVRFNHQSILLKINLKYLFSFSVSVFSLYLFLSLNCLYSNLTLFLLSLDHSLLQFLLISLYYFFPHWSLSHML